MSERHAGGHCRVLPRSLANVLCVKRRVAAIPRLAPGYISDRIDDCTKALDHLSALLSRGFEHPHVNRAASLRPKFLEGEVIQSL